MLQIPEIELGSVVFKPMARRVYESGVIVELTKIESCLFEALALCANMLVTRRMLSVVLQLGRRRIALTTTSV